MNSAIQALSNCPPLRDYFCLLNVDTNLSTPNSNADVSAAFRDLLNRVWSEYSQTPIKPTNFLFVSVFAHPLINSFVSSKLGLNVHSFVALDSRIPRSLFGVFWTSFTKNWNIPLTTLLSPYFRRRLWAQQVRLPTTETATGLTRWTVEWVQRM